MNIKAIDEAMEEMRRFEKAAKAVKKKYQDQEHKKGGKFYDVALWGGPETAALRRASLDLTRALARMRK